MVYQIPCKLIENFERQLVQTMLLPHTPVTLNQSQGHLEKYLNVIYAILPIIIPSFAPNAYINIQMHANAQMKLHQHHIRFSWSVEEQAIK